MASSTVRLSGALWAMRLVIQSADTRRQVSDFGRIFIVIAGTACYGCWGGPIKGALTGAAKPINTTNSWPPGFVWKGTFSQLLASHTFPEGSIATPVFRVRPSKEYPE